MLHNRSVTELEGVCCRRCFKAIVDNLCPECASGDLDMGEDNGGRWALQWKFIDCPSGDLKLLTEGGNKWCDATAVPSAIVTLLHFVLWTIQCPDGRKWFCAEAASKLQIRSLGLSCMACSLQVCKAEGTGRSQLCDIDEV